MNLKRGLLSTAAALAASLISGSAAVEAGPILPGNVVVTRVGTGAAALTSNGTEVFVDEYTPAGGFVQTIPMPTAAAGSNNPYAASGTQTEQSITLSGNGSVLMLGGYNAIPGATTPASNATARVIGLIDVATGAVDTSTSLTDFGSTASNNLRSVVSADGVNFYASTASGTRYVSGVGPGTTTSTQLVATNSRNAGIFGSQLYVSSGSTPLRGVNTMSGGLPTTAGQSLTRIPGQTDASNASTWDFWFADSTTLYVADDSTTATVGGLQKWKFDGANWIQQYRIFSDTAAVTFGLRGLAGYTDGLGNAVLYATTNQTQTRLVTITDSIAATVDAGTKFTALATSAANTQFRGVEIIPIPEPTSLALLMGGSLLLVRRRRAN